MLSTVPITSILFLVTAFDNGITHRLTSNTQVNAFVLKKNNSHLIVLHDHRHRDAMKSSPSLLLQMSKEDIDDNSSEETTKPRAESASNVLGTSLQCCCSNVRNTNIGTGFYRNGYCSTGEDDLGRHTVCIQATAKFLAYSQKVGNDLSTPVPQYMFPGLEEGDRWCLCAQRWVQAYQDGCAPQLYLQATHEKTLTYVPIEILRMYAVDGDESDEALNKLNEQRSKLNDLLKE